MRFGSIITSAAAVVLAAPAARAQGYQFTFVSAPGSYDTYFTGVNDAGRIVGQGDGSGSFVYAGGTFASIQAPEAFSARGINDLGVIAGSTAARRYAYVDSAGVFRRVDPVGPSPAVRPFATASGINNAGDVVGDYSDGTSGPGDTHGYLYRAGVFTRIDAPFGAAFTSATAINNVGQIVGDYSGSDVTSSPRGYVRGAGGTFARLDAPGAFLTLPTGINDAGDVIGRAAYRDPASGSGVADSAFIVRGGVFTTLSLGGAAELFPLDVNNAGEIVGYSRSGTSIYSPYVGFIATPLASTVPEPATLALSAAGLALVGAVARRARRRATDTAA